MSTTFREEQDAMGTVKVPVEAYYGAQTQRALENFSISGIRFPSSLIRALGLIKGHAARVNLELGLLEPPVAEAAERAAREVAEGRFDSAFVVEVFQTGSGTSTNMNANEVIAGRANEILTGRRGGRSPVHPNDHVNLGQSSNDVIPTAIHIAALGEIDKGLIPAVTGLKETIEEKARAFREFMKIGRTHLQDAVPLSLGQEFGGYARQVELGMERILGARAGLLELALGGTAVGTGLNTHPEFAQKVIAGISRETGCDFREARNHFAAQGAQDALVAASAGLRTFALTLIKIANDIRWLSSGPRCGLGEITIPALQPGSSIMPGKVNPVIPEAVIQAAGQVIANDAAVAFGGQGGNFELNAMLPLMGHNLLQSIQLLQGAAQAFSDKCIRGITADRERCARNLEQSLALATALVPEIGYDRAADLAKVAYKGGKTIREAAILEGILPEERINMILDSIVGGKDRD